MLLPNLCASFGCYCLLWVLQYANSAIILLLLITLLLPLFVYYYWCWLLLCYSYCYYRYKAKLICFCWVLLLLFTIAIAHSFGYIIHNRWEIYLRDFINFITESLYAISSFIDFIFSIFLSSVYICSLLSIIGSATVWTWGNGLECKFWLQVYFYLWRWFQLNIDFNGSLLLCFCRTDWDILTDPRWDNLLNTLI